MKVYTAQGSKMFTMKGNEIFHNYFDTVNANIRTAVEHKSDERDLGQDNKENSRAGKDSPIGADKPSKNIGEKAAKNAAEKMRNTAKEVKQPVKGR